MTCGSATLVVVYDRGSVAPLRLAEVATELDISLVFVLPQSAHAVAMRPVLELLGKVIDTHGRTFADLTRELTRAQPSGIVTFSETQLGFTAQLASALGLRHHDPKHIPAITRKSEQRRALQEAGVESVRFAVVSRVHELEHAVDVVGLPLIVKPVVGVASRNTFAVRSVEECRNCVTSLLGHSTGAGHSAEQEVILEEFLAGRKCSWRWGDYMAVDCIATDNVVHPIYATGKFALAAPFRERGCYIPPHENADEVDEIKALAARAVSAVNIRSGIADVEIKLTPTGPRVIEVNGRLGGWVDDVAIRSGATSPALIAVKAALNIPIPLEDVKTASRIAFHYLVIPPVTASRVRSIDEAGHLRSIKNVERVSVLASTGMDVSPARGTNSSVAELIGSADSYADLQRTVDAIEGMSWITYE